ncbi:hypothetical protein DXG01_004153 [Tephrocybe rancida]|nr:hypothetical protein DXG01_004153 [Tephrocybe rancida]
MNAVQEELSTSELPTHSTHQLYMPEILLDSIEVLFKRPLLYVRQDLNAFGSLHLFEDEAGALSAFYHRMVKTVEQAFRRDTAEAAAMRLPSYIDDSLVKRMNMPIDLPDEDYIPPYPTELQEPSVIPCLVARRPASPHRPPSRSTRSRQEHFVGSDYRRASPIPRLPEVIPHNLRRKPVKLSAGGVPATCRDYPSLSSPLSPGCQAYVH